VQSFRSFLSVGSGYGNILELSSIIVPLRFLLSFTSSGFPLFYERLNEVHVLPLKRTSIRVAVIPLSPAKGNLDRFPPALL